MKASSRCLLALVGAATASASSLPSGVDYAAAWGAAAAGVDSQGRAWKRTRRNEIIELPGLEKMAYAKPMPHEYIDLAALPLEFDWGYARGGRSFLTKVMNQHIPQYCGSCWAQAAMSALADRVKIARDGRGTDNLLSVQYILNCGNYANNFTGGTCLGGSSPGAYQFVKAVGHIPYETCQPYEACSFDSVDGICPHGEYKCDALHTCRTCIPVTYHEAEGHVEGPPLMGSRCVGMDLFPKVTLAEYGVVRGETQMLAELYTRGPMACDVNAIPLEDYMGGIIPHNGIKGSVDHVVSVVGFGVGKSSKKDKNKYWRVRNSWGEYWGELGFFRVDRGNNEILIEQECSWATPYSWSEVNQACLFDGSHCQREAYYEDPAIHHDPMAESQIGMLASAVSQAVGASVEAATMDLAAATSDLGVVASSSEPAGKAEQSEAENKYQVLYS